METYGRAVDTFVRGMSFRSSALVSITVSKHVITEGSYLIDDSFTVSWHQTLLWMGTKGISFPLANQRTVISYRILANASAEL